MNMKLNDNGEKIEIEAKFVCSDGLSLDAFLDVVNTIGFRSVKDAPCFQTDVYLDTPNYLLLNSDTALRIRHRGETYVGAYKSSKSSEKQQGPIFERKEVEWVLLSDEIKLWNNEKKPTIPSMVINVLNLGGQILRKVLVVVTHRYTATISDNDG